MNRLRNKIARNLSGYGYSQIITLGSQILVVPFFISAWGVRQYGEWLVLTSVPLFLAMLELGVSEASATRASLASGSKDLFIVRRTLDTAMAFSLVTASVVAIIGNSLSIYVPWTNYLDLNDFSPHTATIIFSSMSFYLAFNFLVGPITAWLKAMDQTALSAFSTANRRASEMAVTTVSLYLGAGPATLAVCLMVTSLATTIAYYVIALNRSNIGAMSLKHADMRELRTVIWPALSYMALPLAQVVTLQGGILLLNSLAGATSVAAFTMARTMVRLLMQIGIVFNSAMRPEVSRLLGSGQTIAAKRTVINGSLIAAVIIVMGIIGVAVLGPYILELWSTGKIVLSSEFLTLLALHAAANVIWYVPSTLLFAQNRHGNISWLYMFFSIASMSTWFMLSTEIEPQVGAALMMLLPELLMVGVITATYLLTDNNKYQI